MSFVNVTCWGPLPASSERRSHPLVSRLSPLSTCPSPLADDAGCGLLVRCALASCFFSILVFLTQCGAAVRFPFLQAAAEGLVVDSAIVKGQGAVADVLVTWGKLKPKDIVVAGTEYGKVRG